MADPLSIVHFSGDVWEHVCPIIRVESPACLAGMRVIHGNRWEGKDLFVEPGRVMDGDLILIQRDFPGYTEAYERVIETARKANKPVVYELDDLLPELPEEHPDSTRYRRIRCQMLKAVVEADAVTCSTPALAEYLRPLNSRVSVLPNLLDPAIWHIHAPGQQSARGKLRIGYMGGRTHKADLEMISPVLVRLLRLFGESLHISFWGSSPPKALAGWRGVTSRDVALVDYRQFVRWFVEQQVDVWIAPLQDHLFNRCKSPLKYLEYSFLRAPGVYSRVSPYQMVVTQGEDGYLADTPEEWEEYLTRLLNDSTLREDIAARAKEKVEREWMLTPEKALMWKQAYETATGVEKRGNPQAVSTIGVLQRWLDDLEHKLQENDTITEHLKDTLNREKSEKQQAQMELEGMRSSASWRVLLKIGALRNRLAPPQSIGGKALNLFKRALMATARGGIKELVRKSVAVLSRGRFGKAAVVTPERSIVFSSVNRAPYPSPQFTIMIIRDGICPNMSTEDVIRWCRTQTWQGFEVVLWDKTIGTLTWIYPIEATRQVDDWNNVAEMIAGRYVLAASYDLLSMPPATLETSLVALESEGLAFVVNGLGTAGVIAENVVRGALPGDARLPLLRTIARKEVLDEDLNLNLSVWAQNNGEARVVGKVITQSVQTPDVEASLPFEKSISGGRYSAWERLLLINVPEKGQVPLSLTPVADVLPGQLLQFEKPVVLMLHPFLAMGGAERIALNVMRGLQERFQFVVATQEYHDLSLGTTVEEFRSITPYVYTFPDFLEPVQYLSMLQYLIDKFHPEILYIANGSNWIYDNLPQIRRDNPGVKIINQVYDHLAGWINRYNDVIVKAIDAHIGSNELIDRAYLQKGVVEEKIYHIENGVDAVFYDPSFYTSDQKDSLKQTLGLPRDKKIVTFLGRMHPQKRPMDFLELARRFANDDSLFFLMVGDGILADAVNIEIQTRGIRNLHRRAFYTPSRDIFAVSDLLVMTSEYEGMPMVVLEAQAMGVPVVATDVGNIRKVLQATQGGKAQAAVGDIHALYQGISEVLAEPPSSEKMRKMIIEQFSIPAMAERYAQAFLLERYA